MAHQILQLPKAALTGSLALKPGWKISLFLTTTTTPTPAYTTSALTTTHTQPVEADAAGIMPAIFLDPAILYKCSVYDQNDVLQYTVDPCNDSVLSQSIIGALLYPATSAEAAVTIADYSIPSHEKVGVFIPNRYKVNASPGVTNMDSAFADAVAVAVAAGGGKVQMLPESYGVTGIELAEGVYIVGDNVGESAGGASELVALAGASVDLVSTPGTAMFHSGIVGVKMTGLGAGTALRGVHFDNLTWGTVRWCYFDQFADNAIKLDSDSGACHIAENLAINCLLDRTRAAKEGVLDIDGADHRVEAGEYTASLSALTDSDARCGAVVVRGANHFLSKVIGEISDFGIATIACTGDVRFVDCRADLNWGNGVENGGNARFSMCSAINNGRQTTNTYDGFYSTSGSGAFSNCFAYSSGAPVHRYGFNDTFSGDTGKNLYDSTNRSIGHGTRSFNFNSSAGSAWQTPNGPPRTLPANDTTPSLEGYGNFGTNNGSATSITAFDDGAAGQMVWLHIFDANTTIVHDGSNITTKSAANLTPAAGEAYLFQCVNGTGWRQVQ